MYKTENLTKLKKMDALAPEVMKTFWAFDKAAVTEGAIPVKYKELIAVAVALTTQCSYCISIHSGNARKAGATEAELTEAAMVLRCVAGGKRRLPMPRTPWQIKLKPNSFCAHWELR